MDVAAAYLDEARRGLRGHKRLAEGAMEQVSDAEFFATLDAEANSIALLVKHMTGNMWSRFTDFLTSDGEKPDRHRDTEFERDAQQDSRAALMQRWEAMWKLVLETIGRLKPEDLSHRVTIRGVEHTVMQAVQRQVAHYAYHTGQIVLLAKHAKGAQWKSLSIPRGQSETFGREAEAAHRKRQQ